MSFLGDRVGSGRPVEQESSIIHPKLTTRTQNVFTLNMFYICTCVITLKTHILKSDINTQSNKTDVSNQQVNKPKTTDGTTSNRTDAANMTLQLLLGLI